MRPDDDSRVGRRWQVETSVPYSGRQIRPPEVKKSQRDALNNTLKYATYQDPWRNFQKW